jgi:GT2 family glycosyltransferase
MATPGTSVVVCVYTMRRWDDIVSALDALEVQTHAVQRVIAVVDHNDELLSRLSSAAATRRIPVDVIPNSRGRGLSGARNTAIEVCTTDLVAFLDDDARPESTWLELLVQPFCDPRVQITGGRATPNWPNDRPRWFPEEFDWVVGSTYKGMPTDLADVRNVHGASMAFRSEVFARIGGFDEGLGRIGTLPVGCEETELCIRLAQAEPSARIVFCPESLVHHRVSDDRTRFAYFVRRGYSEGISKARISRLVGAATATKDERGYAGRVLPRGIAHNIGLALHGDPAGIARAAVMLAGVAATTVGYVQGVRGAGRVRD